MTHSVALALLFLCCCHSVLAAPELEIKGNTRTRTNYIKKLYQNCNYIFDNPADELLKNCMMNARIFSSVEIKNEGDKKIIEVTERWTLIPIPMARSDRREKKFGLYLFEQNFLGMGKIAVVGGMKGDRSESYFLMYSDPFLFFSNYFLHTSFSHGDNNPLKYQKEDVIDGHGTRETQAKFSIGRRWGLYQTVVGLNWSNLDFYQIDNHPFVPNGNREAHLLLSLRYNNSLFKFYFQEGTSVELDVGTDINHIKYNKETAKVEWRWIYQKNIISDHALQLQNTTNWTFRQGSEDILYLGGDRGLRGVNQFGIWARHASRFSVDYQIPVNDQSYGTWTIAPFVDYTLYQNYMVTDHWKNTYGGGIGGYLFLKKIALPGLGIIFGYNPHFEESYGTFFVGRSM